MTKENLPIKLDYNDPEIIKTVRKSICPDFNDAEFELFRQAWISTGLNPFKRELWGIKSGGRVQIMTGINGFYTIANNHCQYDGQSEAEFGKDDYGIFCKVSVYRKDRKFPQVAKVWLNEFNKGQANWRTMPRYMISKCAEAIALRKAFPQELNGIYATEEMPEEYGEKFAGKTIDITPEPAPQQAKVVEAKPETKPVALADLKPADGLLKAFPGSTVDPQPEFYYDLNKIDPKRKDAAVALIDKAGGRWWQQHDIWVSPVRITKLGRVFCTKAEVEKRDSMPPASYTDAEFDRRHDNVLGASSVRDSKEDPIVESEELQHLQRNQ